MSLEGVNVWKVSEGELTNSPVLSSFCSLNIDAEYVFISLNTIFILNIYDSRWSLFCYYPPFLYIFLNQVFYTCNIWLINKFISLFILYNSSMGMNQHKSYFATSYHGDIANQLYQYTFKERMSMNQHKLHTRVILLLHFVFRDFNHSREGGSESAIFNQEVTTIVPNKGVQ